MDVTDAILEGIKKIEPEDGENIQNDEEQTEYTISNLPSTLCTGKRIRSKEDDISVILAKQSKDMNILLSIQEQNKQLVTSMMNLCEEDDTNVFFKSMAMTVKKMPPKAIKEAKLKVLSLITEIDNKYSTVVRYSEKLRNRQ